MDCTQLTTSGLIDLVRADPNATERELEILSRLMNAIEMIEDQAHQIARLDCVGYADGDS